MNHSITVRSQDVKIGAKTMTKIERMAGLLARLSEMGFSFSEAKALRRIEATLQRWSEQECGCGNDYCSWSIERDEATGKPYRVTYPHHGKSYREAIPDREAGAKVRLDKIMSNHPDYVAYHQTDPRGCAIYIVSKRDLGTDDINQVYNRGVAIC